MACPFDQACERHPTPPLSPSTSSGSSRGSSVPSFSPSTLSSLLPRDLDNSHPTCPAKYRDPSTTLGLMPDHDDDEAMTLDNWEEEHERAEGSQDLSFDPSAQLISFPFHLASSPTRASERTPYSQLPSQSLQHSQGSDSLPSPDVIDVTKLARQDQPPPAYENVDEHPACNVSRSSTLTTHAARPLPMPPLNRLGSSSSIHSVSPTTDAPPAEPHENANPAPQSPSSPDHVNPMLPNARPFPSSVGTPQSPVASLGLLHPLDHPPSQDWLGKCSPGISPLSSQSPFNTLTPRMTSEPAQQSVSRGSFNHDSSWTPNSSCSGTQQGTTAVSVSSRPISMSGSIQTLSPPPPYSPCEASSSRSASRPSSEYVNETRPTHQPPPATSVSSSRGLPPPAPPMILDSPPARHNSTRNSRAPHEPFLNDAPPPPDSWIAVETTPVEYRLVVRLPGFRRDAITLAARRRRVLHVVADSWEPGGGHFERRISFGYDADLSQVRAEFNGEILLVIVPRRAPALTWYGEACE